MLKVSSFNAVSNQVVICWLSKTTNKVRFPLDYLLKEGKSSEKKRFINAACLISRIVKFG